jgi:hypothetical protein
MSLLPEHAFVKLLLVDDGRREIETHYITGDLVYYYYRMVDDSPDTYIRVYRIA